MADRFVITPKHPSLESLSRWRKGVFALNAARRFRHTVDVDKLRQAKDRRNLRIGLIVTKAALIFIGKGPKVTVKELQALQSENGFEAFTKLGGLKGICNRLDVDLDKGIKGDEEDIKQKQLAFGINKFDKKEPPTFCKFFWDALKDPTLIILMICSVISIAIGIPTEGIGEGWFDGVGIFISILIVVLVTAGSDYRQSLQFRVLENEKYKIKVSVIRNGNRTSVHNYDLVVGDIVLLSTGDQICADGIYVSGNSLTIDESSLTGESEPVHPSTKKPFLLSGTMVLDGEGRMLVTGVGMNTEWGILMSKLSEAGDSETPLQVRLNGVATTVGKIGLFFALLTFFVLLIRFLYARFEEGFDNWRSEYLLEIVDYFATAVTILVVAVPEGLPLAVTLSLAYAMNEMVKDNALVRNLAACETMGSATCICSDKTGTLTANHMTVVKVWCAGNADVAERISSGLSDAVSKLLLEAMFMNTAGDIVENGKKREVLGSPTESSILEFGHDHLHGEFRKVRSKCQIVRVEPFNSTVKKMSTLVKLENGKYRSHCKGASEIILEMCDYKTNAAGESVPLSPSDRQELKEVINGFAKEALRTICFAFRDIDNLSEIDGDLPNSALTLIAIVGIKDPLRQGVKEAVELCIKAGIKVRMVTGDNKETASAIARDCGILTETSLAVQGSEFRNWNQQELLDKVQDIAVVARSSPTDKLNLVNYLKDRGEVVSVTGDGTNDAPALHEADIGLAMGIAGTEVAKASADIVILDDNFSTIVNVARWGRSVYTNIQKFVQFQLTVNLVALVINFVSACITGEAPLTAVQLLWVNLIMDTLGALALATEPPYDALMERPPVGRKGSFITNVMWRNIIGQAIYQLIVLWILQFLGIRLLHLTGDDADDVLNTMIFNSFVFLQVFNEINARDMEKINVFSNIFTNKIFLAIIAFTVIFQVIIVEFLGAFADTVPLSAEQWAICILPGFIGVFVNILVKLLPVPSKPFAEYFSRPSTLKDEGHASGTSDISSPLLPSEARQKD